jgi:hypothetical protein
MDQFAEWFSDFAGSLHDLSEEELLALRDRLDAEGLGAAGVPVPPDEETHR